MRLGQEMYILYEKSRYKMVPLPNSEDKHARIRLRQFKMQDVWKGEGRVEMGKIR